MYWRCVACVGKRWRHQAPVSVSVSALVSLFSLFTVVENVVDIFVTLLGVVKGDYAVAVGSASFQLPSSALLNENYNCAYFAHNYIIWKAIQYFLYRPIHHINKHGIVPITATSSRVIHQIWKGNCVTVVWILHEKNDLFRPSTVWVKQAIYKQ